jgi:hypothetical protein
MPCDFGEKRQSVQHVVMDTALLMLVDLVLVRQLLKFQTVAAKSIWQ